ncbi:MAG: cadherin domain-containing protein [Haliscomenobacter sp.]|nr:cadherin domain-containing protein [Haliscomenobacter sp.]MBK9488883.1 cadherin domain-containing protein [Haliscomenobacter sp.]
MKKSLQLLTTLGLVLLGGVLFGQNLEFTLRYNIPLARYEVYARPSATNATFAWGPSQISIVAPAVVPDAAFTITSVSAGAWQDNSIIIAPTVTPAFDYHGVGSLGAPTNLVMTVEKLIFHFTIAGGCYDGLRLFINGSDPNSAAPGMGGGDFSNTVSDGLAQERYIGNYNNTGTTCFPDTDGDTVTNNVDLDDDNDGILDTVENGQLSTDTDGDGIINSLDLDSDNDGISDVDEAGGTDVDRDGEADDNDGMPANNNGIPSTAGTGDTLVGDDFDNDARPNPYDLDSDNDAINDIVESGNPNLVDADDNGVVDGPDTDGDGIPDSADNFVGFGDSADPAPVNTDGMAGPNYLDIDSDGDGLTDIEESGVANPGILDANNDGFIDNNADPEGDGIPQVVDGAPAVFGDANDPTLPDNTNDGDPDYTDPNNPPVITSDGGGPTAGISVPENTTAVTTVTATDPENLYGTPKFSITGGADAALFTINAATGVLTFLVAPNFEIPTDAGLNNVYDVQVTVTDHGALTDVQDIAVTVTNVNEAPSITSNGAGPNASVSIPENTTPVTTVMTSDPENGAITYSITGGADAALFTIDPMTGALSFITPKDFENPTDAGANNVYDVQVTATDPGLLTDVQNIAVTVTDVNEPPSITSNGAGPTAIVPVVENNTAVTTVTATDPENAYNVPKFTLPGGADAALFTINAATGALSFITAPNFEVPTDANTDNNYEVQVTVTDAGLLTDVQDITVPVSNANENPMITSDGAGPNAGVSVPENTTAVTTVMASDPENGVVMFSITGGADGALFTIDPLTGVLSFITPKDFENPTDAGANNVYDVQVTATDPLGGTDVQAIAVTVTNVNEPPSITSDGAGPTANVPVAENTTAVTTVTAADPENAYNVPKFTITGGADAALFTINAATGALSFITAPNFEVPTDANTDNNYEVQVTVTDAGLLTDVQAITVPVTNANDAPIITSDGGGPNASVSVPENTTAVTTVTSMDPDGNPVTYSITGGADGALFVIDPMTGVLSFITPKDFENPTDAGANNIYNVQVTASDGNGGTDVQAIAVTVTNVNEAPSITSNGGGATANISIPENSTPVTTVTATDPENLYGTPKFSISGGADAALFTIDANTGALAFISGRNFESPTDAGANNVYDVQVTVTDAGLLTDIQDIAVTITDADENGRLRAKVLLQGALLGTITPGVMRDDLRSNGYVPLNDPYTLSGNPRFAHAGSGAAASTTNLVLNTDAGTPDAIVDWVFVELRSSSNSSIVLETRAALVQRDGDVVSPVDGDSPLEFTNLAGTSYFVSIKHRNHLGAMTASTQTLTVGGTVVDFTTMSNADLFNNTGYDGAEMITIGSVKALWAGNANADVKVKYQGPSNDNATILSQVLTHPSNVSGTYNFDLALGYFSGDINMDGKVKYQGTGNDPAFIFANIITNYTLNLMDLYNYDLFIEQLP